MTNEANGGETDRNSSGEENLSEQTEKQHSEDSSTVEANSNNINAAGEEREPPMRLEDSTSVSGDRTQVIGASVKGPAHDQPGDENEDAYETRRLADDICVIAVADGLGSAPAGGRGARIATKASIEAAAGKLEDIARSETGVPLETEMRKSVELAAHKAREAVENEADEAEIPLEHLATTLIVVLLVDGHITSGHIGDGAVVAKVHGELRFISFPGETEYVNQVVPLTSNNWEENWRIHQDKMPDAVAAFSDGLRRAGLEQTQDGCDPFPGFFDPLFSHLRSAEGLSKAKSDLEGLLRSEKLSEQSSDDKTLVVAFRDRSD